MLYIMRHGKTDWNLKHKLQGQTDVPLNDMGREMARKAAIDCANVNFDICYSSPLIRAKETARLVLEGRDVPIVTDDRLKEMAFGEYEGIENSFAIPDCPINIIFQHPEQYVEPFEGAETFADLYKRTGDFLENVAYPLVKESKDVLIVGHGAMNSSIICQVRNVPIQDFWKEGIENCKLIKLL